MFTESQAWAYLARKWDHPEMYGGCETAYYANIRETKGHVSHIISFGLCLCIDDLRLCGKITQDVCEAMAITLSKIKPAIHGLYWWPTDLEGAVIRAKICRDFAAQTRKPRSRKK